MIDTKLLHTVQLFQAAFICKGSPVWQITFPNAIQPCLGSADSTFILKNYTNHRMANTQPPLPANSQTGLINEILLTRGRTQRRSGRKQDFSPVTSGDYN